MNPKDADAWNDKGYALYKTGKYKEAIQAYDEAIEIRMRDMLKGRWMPLV
jgi:Flp pilus assembly protein TadD